MLPACHVACHDDDAVAFQVTDDVARQYVLRAFMNAFGLLNLFHPARLAAPSQIAVDGTCAVAALAFSKPYSSDSLRSIASSMGSQTAFKIAG